MAATIANAASTLSSLLQQTSLDDHQEILEAANSVLQKSKNDIGAQHVRAVALIKLDRFNDAVKVFEEAGDNLKDRAPLEYAYVLYKSGRLQDAETVADSAKVGRGMKHVLAQTAYRAQKFDRSANLYHQLAGPQAEAHGEAADLRINHTATDAQLAWAGQGHLANNQKPSREDMDAFETSYNAACGSIARGELGQADVLLRRAMDLCNASDLSEEEKKAELLPMTVQRIYVLSKLGKPEEAEKLSTKLAIDDIPDVSTKHIARVNSLAATKDIANPYLAQRLFQSIPSFPPTDQPFKFQSSLLRQDAYVMDLLSHKYDGVARSTAEYLSRHALPSIDADVTSASVINAAAHARNRTGKAALKQILPLLERRPNDVGLLLTIVHLYLLTNNHGSAIQLMEAFLKRLEESTDATDPDVRYAPGLVATLVSLYQAQGRKGQIRTELAKAASYWRHKSKAASPALLRAAGAALVESHAREDLFAAVDLFSALLEQNPTDQGAIAGYVAAASATDADRVTEDQLNSLPSIDSLIQGIDIATLEAAGVATLATPEAQSRKRPAGDKEKPAKPKRIRKSRLPKDYDPNKKPDPERWLPLRDRSYYRPKGKKGKAKLAGLTQGGVVPEERAATAVEQTARTSGQPKNKKKKGKGGKW